MLPTLNTKGDVILVEKFSVPMERLRRGDIIIATSPEDPKKLICKRIIGMVRDYVGLPLFNNAGK